MSTRFCRMAADDAATTPRGRMGEVVVAHGRIASVGEGAPVGATVVDVDGGLLLPGFTDAHVHPVQGGLERLACDLSGLPVDRDAYLATHPSPEDSHDR